MTGAPSFRAQAKNLPLMWKREFIKFRVDSEFTIYPVPHETFRQAQGDRTHRFSERSEEFNEDDIGCIFKIFVMTTLNSLIFRIFSTF